MSITIDSQAIEAFKGALAIRLHSGCKAAVGVVREATPVDTKRLWTSTRVEVPVVEDDAIHCDIVAGGVSLYGIVREQSRMRDVDYAIFVEMRTPYIRPLVPRIGQLVVRKLRQ